MILFQACASYSSYLFDQPNLAFKCFLVICFLLLFLCSRRMCLVVPPKTKLSSHTYPSLVLQSSCAAVFNHFFFFNHISCAAVFDHILVDPEHFHCLQDDFWDSATWNSEFHTYCLRTLILGYLHNIPPRFSGGFRHDLRCKSFLHI